MGIPIEQRARVFLLENLCGDKKRFYFLNPKFKGELEFLETNGYIAKINNPSNSHYVVTRKGIEFEGLFIFAI